MSSKKSGKEPGERYASNSHKKSDIGLLSEQIGQIIFQLRKKKNVTLNHLSERTGIAVRKLDRLERGQGEIHFDILFTIARGLKVPLSALIRAG